MKKLIPVLAAILISVGSGSMVWAAEAGADPIQATCKKQAEDEGLKGKKAKKAIKKCVKDAKKQEKDAGAPQEK